MNDSSDSNSKNADELVMKLFGKVDEDEMRLEDERLKVRSNEFYTNHAHGQFISLVERGFKAEAAIRQVERQKWHDEVFDKLEDGYEHNGYFDYFDIWLDESELSLDEPEWICGRLGIPSDIRDNYKNVINQSLLSKDLKRSLTTQLYPDNVEWRKEGF